MATYRGFVGCNQLPIIHSSESLPNRPRVEFFETVVVTDDEHARNFEGTMGSSDQLSTHLIGVEVEVASPCTFKEVRKYAEKLGYTDDPVSGEPLSEYIDNNVFEGRPALVESLVAAGYDGVVDQVAMSNYEIKVVIPLNAMIFADPTGRVSL